MAKFGLHRASRLREGALLLVVVACTDSDVTSPPTAGVRTAPAAREISVGLTRTGRIAFVSTRAGNDNTEIYTMNPDGTGVTRLSNSAATDVDPAWSPGRSKIAFASTRASDSFQRIYTMNADGSGVTQLTNSGGPDKSPAWSPDGSKIAFTHVEIHHPATGHVFFSTDIYVINANGSGLVQLTKTGRESSPAWSPDGSVIAFESTRDGNSEIYLMRADGSGITRLTHRAANDYDPAWSPDGTQLAFDSEPGGCCGNFDIYLMNADGSAVTRLTRDPHDDSGPTWSPDGSKIVFDSDRSGKTEIYLMNSNGRGVIRLTNAAEDFSPAWTP
jgi:Tol biopolymer transport system component